ncbi:MAG: threonylcarbamoyl-AMP synthase [Ruminococcaceae bacterium]|nr:threonylcarbamoyl-AMP synthase [Oscillospiraceae bacterium]
METKIIYPDNISEAAECIKNGGTVVFPTETVYGLGGDAFNEKAIDKIYNAKGRPGDNPLIVHISGFDELDNLVSEIKEYAKILMEKFWPGPLTLIFKKKPTVPLKVTAGRNTVAVRFPSNETAQRLIKEAGTPIAAPSANLSGSPSPTVCSDVIDDLFSRVDYIIDATGCEIGLESTVVDVSTDEVVILRPGGVTLEMIREYIPDAKLDSGLIDEDAIPKCPGLKYTHYSPKADVVVVQGEKDKVREYISSKVDEFSGVISYKSGAYESAGLVLYAGNNMEEYAHNLFSHLRTFDKHNIKKVYAEFSPEPGMGVAVQNRLYKSAGHKIIEV